MKEPFELRITDTRALPHEPSVAELRRISGERWEALPSVIRATFECAGRISLHQSLQALGVEAVPSRTVARAYESKRGPLVVTVWHDHIEHEADGRLAYRIDTLEWQAEATGSQGERVARVRELLTAHLGQEVYVLLLKREWNTDHTERVESNALDIVMWMLESAGHGRFVLRRPMVRRGA
jgi:hypothetical protein